MPFEFWRRRHLDWKRRLREKDQHQRGDPFRILLDARFWARHRETFAKSRQGRDRRTERRFVISQKRRRIPRRIAA